MSKAKQKPQRWENKKRTLGIKLMLCRGCGRKAEMMTASVLAANARREPITCRECGSVMSSV